MKPQFLYEKELKGAHNTVKRKKDQYRRLMQHLYYNGDVSIAELVKSVNISQPLVASLVDDLLAYGAILDKGIGKSIGGRRPNLYCVNPSYQYVIGVEINLYVFTVAIFDLSNKIIYRKEYRECELTNTEDYIQGLVNKVNLGLSELNISKDKVLALGLSMPGLVDSNNGINHTHLSFPKEGLSNYLGDKLGLMIRIENDARTMALGEIAFGKAKDKKNVLCLNLSNGIGLGMILNGELHTGKNGFSGEFGHILIDPEGQLCTCGKIGCLETLASGKVLIDRIKKGIQEGQQSILAQIIKEGKRIFLSNIVDAVNSGDQFAIDQLSKVAEYLGKGLVTLIHLLNPETIIIGGKLAGTGKFIIDPLKMALNKYAMEKISSETELVSSDLQDDAALMGTMENVMKQVLNIG
ncbi:ROK family protein [Marinifilum sp. RC60d5]|uniref:ROK family protein n=1 Tax=Marinifilum sp. RC60d5 TaxID=3458414 RepID=UPI0040366194